MEDLRKLYQKAFEEELAKRKQRGERGEEITLRVLGGRSQSLVLEEGVFGRGENVLKFRYNTAKNRELKKKIEQAGYALRKNKISVGFYFTVSPEEHGQKYFEIEKIAYQKIADYLNEQGYDVYVVSKMDLSRSS